MNCKTCGKAIPKALKVCPYCNWASLPAARMVPPPQITQLIPIAPPQARVQATCPSCGNPFFKNVQAVVMQETQPRRSGLMTLKSGTALQLNFYREGLRSNAAIIVLVVLFCVSPCFMILFTGNVFGKAVAIIFFSGIVFNSYLWLKYLTEEQRQVPINAARFDRWRQLSYCERCNVVFDLNGKFVPTERVTELYW